MSKIEWTNETWNPWAGCTRVSEGCRNCYAARLSKRMRGKPGYTRDFYEGPDMKDRLAVWNQLRAYKSPRMIFVGSMTDLFHEDVPLWEIVHIFRMMVKCPQHVYQVLTKRAHRIPEVWGHLSKLDGGWPFIPQNLWLGVSVESMRHIDRIASLLSVHPHYIDQPDIQVRFLSLEPLLGPIHLPERQWKKLDWVIVGGESGPGARPMEKRWVAEIRDQCQAAGVRFFFKQWGGINKRATGRLLEGRLYDEMPPLPEGMKQ